MIADCTALVFAGGDSRRMGRDKLALELGGQSLLTRALELMRELFPQTLVSVQRPRDGVDAPQICDEIPDAGPLAGLCAGLSAARTPWVFAVAADMPWLMPAVIERLAAFRANHQAVVPVIDGQLCPLTAFYAADALPALRVALARPGKPGIVAALPELDACFVDERQLGEIDGLPRHFADIDTPEDAALAHLHFGR